MIRLFPSVIPLVAFSGSKGVHVYGCFGGSVRATAARDVGLSVLDSWGRGELFSAVKGKNFYKAATYPDLTVEVFPKQEKVGTGGFGNLLRLPLGINQKTGREGFFYDPGAPLDELRPADPEQVLIHGSLKSRSTS
jgi:hypothetical protein